MIGRFHRALFAGAVCLSAFACNSAAPPTTPSAPAAPALQSLALTGTRPMVGTASQFSLVATYSDGGVRDVTAEAAWQSSDPGVATIQTPGSVQGVKLGYVEVSASFHGMTRLESMFVTTSGSYLVTKSDPGDEVGNGSSFAASNIDAYVYNGELSVYDKSGLSTPLLMRGANPLGIGPGVYRAIFYDLSKKNILMTEPRLRFAHQYPAI